jgi:hypothetical protein
VHTPAHAPSPAHAAPPKITPAPGLGGHKVAAAAADRWKGAANKSRDHLASKKQGLDTRLTQFQGQGKVIRKHSIDQ